MTNQEFQYPVKPESVMRILRKRDGLAADDTSNDKTLQDMNPRRAMRELVAWELGDPSWAGWFFEKAESLGFEIKDPTPTHP